MTDLRKAAEMALEALEELRFANAPFLDEAMEALRTALAHPEQKPVAWSVLDKRTGKHWYTHESKYTAQHYANEYSHNEPDGSPSMIVKPLYTAPVDTVNISQERVDETAKGGHEPVSNNKWKNVVIVFNDDPPSTGPNYFGNILNRWSKDFDVYLDGIKGHIHTAPPKREWKGLTDEDINEGTKQSRLYKDQFEPAVRWADAKLKEKNT